MGREKSREFITSALLGRGGPMTSRDLKEETGLARKKVSNVLERMWRAGLVFHMEKPVYEQEQGFKGRGGSVQHTRPHHLYLLRPGEKESVVVKGVHEVDSTA